jgi:hypothetical protein
MSAGYARWDDVRARGQEADPRASEEQAAGKAAARERREAYVRGHQLAEMRAAAGLTQAELAGSLRPASPRSNTARFPASTSSAPTSPRSAEASMSSPGSATEAGR